MLYLKQTFFKRDPVGHAEYFAICTAPDKEGPLGESNPVCSAHFVGWHIVDASKPKVPELLAWRYQQCTSQHIVTGETPQTMSLVLFSGVCRVSVSRENLFGLFFHNCSSKAFVRPVHLPFVRPSPVRDQKWQKNNTQDSNVVPHRSTNRARTCLTSLSRREAVLSCWYGRS
jgi:hypothetical protein